MKERPTNGRVIIVFTEHPIFGILLIPYIAERLNDGTLQLVEQAFHASSEAISMMSEAERQAIDIASYYTEKYLMSLYSREKTVSRFLHKLSKDPARIKNHIRPFIEKKLLEMLALIRENGLPFYQKQAGSKILYAHHAYHINPHNVEIRVTFHVDSKTFRYQLQCYYEGQSFSLSELKPVVVLTSSPVTLLLGMELYFFPHIESARILAFTKKRSISVDASQIEKYIDNIVIPIARYHEIETHGLNIMEEKCACEAILSFEDITYNGQALQLDFRYRDQTFTPDSAIEMKKIVYRKTSGEICFFRRNMIMEEQAVQLLTDTGLQQLNNTYFSLSPKAPEKTLVEWINNHRELLQQSFHLINNAENARYSLDEIHIEQSCDNEVDWFELHITVVIGNLRIPFSRFRKHILEEKREYLLPDGRMILLPEEWFSKYANLLEMGIQTEKGIRLKHTFIGAVQTALGENGIKKIPAKQQIRKVAVPKTLKATLRPYQQKGFSWMVHLYKRGFGGCLADDMGLGKTLQTLTLLQYIYKPSAPKQPATLIVVPTSLLHNWRREAKRFTALSMTEYNNTVTIDKKRPEKFFGRFHLIFTTYGMMKNNIDILGSYRFKYVVLDESQNIKNSDSLNFRSAIQLQSNHRLVLTGTPIENSLKDLWAQFHFIQPDLLGSESAFQKQFIIPIRQGNARVETQLQQLIAPFILRRSKKEVAPELPELTEETIYCDMTGEQNTCYEQEKNSLRNILLQHTQSTDRLHSFSVLNGILRLRQLSCHPQLILPDYTGISGKTTQIIETFDTLQSEGHKVLIFSSFVKHLELLAEAFQERGWKYALLTGSTSNRSSEIAHFTDQKDVQAFLISLKAGGVGLNLTQADYVFIIDPWWNPAAESQAIARAHRIGQDKQVIAYRFITQNSIEEKILHLQDEKRKLAETFVADSESLPILSNEQWVDLL
ncbi:DEAD/DEAH box helicase [Bacteroides caecimuris]|uniref:DEAD/DEAH box helicase n=1 Tax=Bacteroides caecimuris TaxID=1796613 RepID=UPI001C3C2D15|nr:DEAD/DEAH box helicase [Bacteroides caecimuris]